MVLLLEVNGQDVPHDMARFGSRTVTIGAFRYQPARLARRVQKLYHAMWGNESDPSVLQQRLRFEALRGQAFGRNTIEGGDFTPALGASVTLGTWEEKVTVGIALHELAHEMHWRSGGFDTSDDVVYEALALMAEREAGVIREFDNEPYYTASNLIDQLFHLRVFSRQPFRQRWNEMVTSINKVNLADLVNYYVDKNDGLGLARWLRRYSQNIDARERLLQAVATCSVMYSLHYRRRLIQRIVQTRPETPLDKLVQVLQAIEKLDRRYPDDNLGDIIDFCFAPVIPSGRKPLIFGT